LIIAEALFPEGKERKKERVSLYSSQRAHRDFKFSGKEKKKQKKD